MRRLAVLVVLVGAVTMAFGPAAWAREGHDVKGAEAAFLRYVTVVNHRQWGRYFDGLHPAQQRLLKRNAFKACINAQIPDGASVTDVKFTGHQDETATVPGTQLQVTATALTVRYVTHIEGQTEAQNGTVHVVWAKNRWTWVLSAEQVRQCSGSAVLVPPSGPGS